ncbi:MAG: hypothetical protein CSA81_13105 [Acidobacteria bacterium]|nr:MAG: hypothetical protein CSA81_13105 [Acidobacteriota bacterium]
MLEERNGSVVIPGFGPYEFSMERILSLLLFTLCEYTRVHLEVIRAARDKSGKSESEEPLSMR